MLNQKDIIAKNIKITNDKEISYINENNLFSSLTVEGGGVFKKGIAVGMQEKMVPGLIIYDEENFYGFSEKNGLSLLSTNLDYNELTLPDDLFNNKLKPTNNNSSESSFNKDENKVLNIDLEIKDTNNFYIIIPKSYESSDFILTFIINFIYDLNTVISNLSLVFINTSIKNLKFRISNHNCYFDDNFEFDIKNNTIKKIYLEIINKDYFLLTEKNFKNI